MVRTSLDNYSADATNVFSNIATGSAVRTFAFTNVPGFSQLRVPVTFRLYGWNASSGGSLVLTKALTIQGASSSTRSPIVEYAFNGQPGNQVETPASYCGNTLVAGTVKRGSGLSPLSTSNSMAATGWSTSSALNINSNDYFEFSVSPKSGLTFSPESVSVTLARSTSGPRNFVIRTSLDGFSASASNVVSDMGTGVRNLTFSLSEPGEFASLTSTATFRLYGWNASSGGSVVLSGTMALHGTVDLVRYDLAGKSGADFEIFPTTVYDGLHVESLRRGNGITATTTVAGSFSSHGWTTGPSYSGNDYFEFLVVPKKGNRMTMRSLEFAELKNPDGPQFFCVRTNLDAFADEIVSATPTSPAGMFRTFPLDERFSDLQKGIVFRIYAWGAASGGRVWSLKNEIKLRGVVVPEKP